MRYLLAMILLYVGLVLSYAAWKGNAYALTQTKYVNSKGEVIFPAIAKSMEHAAKVGGAMYYTGADGQFYTDITTLESRSFHWATFFKVVAFGFGLALLLLIIARMSSRFSKENALE